MKHYVNLLPEKWRRQMQLRRCIRQWTVGWVLGALAAFTLVAIKYRDLSTAESTIAGDERASGPIRAMQVQNAHLRDRANQVKGRNALVNQLDGDQQVFRLVGLISRSSAQCNGRIQVQKLQFNRSLRTTVPPLGKAPKTSAPADTIEAVVMSLQGVALDNLAISQFVVLLRDTGVFSRVDLKSTALGVSQTPSARSYIIECTL